MVGNENGWSGLFSVKGEEKRRKREEGWGKWRGVGKGEREEGRERAGSHVGYLSLTHNIGIWFIILGSVLH